jgi:hypothetical protein
LCVPINASAQVNSHRRLRFTVRHDATFYGDAVEDIAAFHAGSPIRLMQ